MTHIEVGDTVVVYRKSGNDSWWMTSFGRVTDSNTTLLTVAFQDETVSSETIEKQFFRTSGFLHESYVNYRIETLEKYQEERRRENALIRMENSGLILSVPHEEWPTYKLVAIAELLKNWNENSSHH
ncbi:beta barrel domain-containing protein [Rhodococcus qingshengii]